MINGLPGGMAPNSANVDVSARGADRGREQDSLAGASSSSSASTTGKDTKAPASKDPMQDPKIRQAVRELQRIDQEVRAHEAAHMAAGGQYVRGGPKYSYRTGPDGKRYAVAGEVSIDTSPVPNDPEATLIKMETVRRAATSPAKPSAQDMKVAASAAQAAAQARMQASQLRMQEMKAKSGGETPPGLSVDMRA